MPASNLHAIAGIGYDIVGALLLVLAHYPDLARDGHTFKKAQLDVGRADQKSLF